MSEYQHKEAYSLLTYVGENGARETLWNARDGVTPFALRERQTGALMQCQECTYAPWYVPAVGERVFIDLNEQRARVLAAQRIERLEQQPDLPIPIHQLFETREAAVQDAFRDIFKPGVPDVQVVTAGWLEAMQACRAELLAGPTSGDLELSPLPGPATSTPKRGPISWDDPYGGIQIYDRDGVRISMNRYIQLAGIARYKIVARTDITDHVFVSTVWLGIDHSYSFHPDGSPRPIVFESMVFEATEITRFSELRSRSSDLGGRALEDERLQQRRYHAEAEAYAGHAEMVAAAFELFAAARRRLP